MMPSLFSDKAGDDPLSSVGKPPAAAPVKSTNPVASPFRPPRIMGRAVAAPNPLDTAGLIKDDPLSIAATSAAEATDAAAAATAKAKAATASSQLPEFEARDSSHRSASTDSSASTATLVPPAAFGAAPVDMAPPSFPPPCTPLNPGESLLDRPAAAQCVLSGLHTQPKGTLYLTNLRMLWEPLNAPDLGIRGSANGSHHDDDGTNGIPGVLGLAPPRLLSTPLNSIEKLRKLKASAPGVVDNLAILEAHQKYNARPCLRLALSESDYARCHGVLRSHIGVPSSPTDVRANVTRSYAVLHGTRLSAGSGKREAFSNSFKGWISTYDW